jgi:hypothetical protein
MLEKGLLSVSTLDEKLSLLKEYGLIPQEASAEAIQCELEQIAETMGVTREKLKHMTIQESTDLWIPPLLLSFFSEISATFRWGNSLRIGMTPFIRLINRFLILNINRGIDILDVCYGLKGSIYTKGWLGEHRLSLEPGCLFLAGFIGYSIKIPYIRHSFVGASVIAFAAGFGSHDFDPWFPS